MKNKLIAIYKNSVLVSSFTSNPLWEKEYDRLENLGIYTSQQIHKILEDKDIPEMEEVQKNITFKDYPYINLLIDIGNMSIEDLEKLQNNIDNDFLSKFVSDILLIKSRLRSIEFFNKIKGNLR